MPKVREAAPHSPFVEENDHGHGWEHSLHAALAVLREIDARYARDRARLEASVGVLPIKRHRLTQLDVQCRKEREPIVLRLADIHQRMTPTSFLRTVH